MALLTISLTRQKHVHVAVQCLFVFLFSYIFHANFTIKPGCSTSLVSQTRMSIHKYATWGLMLIPLSCCSISCKKKSRCFFLILFSWPTYPLKQIPIPSSRMTPVIPSNRNRFTWTLLSIGWFYWSRYSGPCAPQPTIIDRTRDPGYLKIKIGIIQGLPTTQLYYRQYYQQLKPGISQNTSQPVHENAWLVRI